MRNKAVNRLGISAKLALLSQGKAELLNEFKKKTFPMTKHANQILVFNAHKVCKAKIFDQSAFRVSVFILKFNHRRSLGKKQTSIN